jgi:predicted 2-oxoglutarate/Fe(II)-dependent dioxygenase YbiX
MQLPEQSKLLTGDRVPPYLGFTDKGALYTSENQTGRTVVLILAKNINAPELPPLLDAFSSLTDDFAAAEADVVALTGEKVEMVFEYSLAHPSRISLVGTLNHFNFPRHIGFDSKQPVILVIDRNMRVAERIETSAPATDVAAQALKVVRRLPTEAVRDIVLPAPVLILPNVFDRAFCKELVEVHKAGPTFESSAVVMGGDGETRIKIKPETKIRQDFLIKREHPLYPKITGIMMNRVVPEIKRCFQAEMTNTDIFLIAKYPGGGGHFDRHRDDRPKSVAFRRFALSINITDDTSGEGFEGGFIRLPEFNMHHYRTPTGAAIIFSVALMHEITPVIKGDRYVLVTHLFDAQGEIERQAVEEKGGDTTAY